MLHTDTLRINRYQEYAAEINRSLELIPWGTVHEVACLLHYARVNMQQVFVMGNGGSAATASHMACDLSKNTVIADQPRYRVMALTDNMSLFSAYSNDCGYENVFAEQLANFVREDDIVIAISASGNSPNVLNAVELAKQHRAITIGWSGYHGGRLSQIVDLPVVVPNHCIEQIEDLHMILAHMITVSVREAMQKKVTEKKDAYATT